MKPNDVVVTDRAGKVQAYAEGFELNTDAGKTLAGLDDGERELASRQESRLLPIDRHQVGLGQNFENGLLLKILDGCAQVDVRAEQENVQQIAELQIGA